MYNPIKSSFLGKVPPSRVHREKSTEPNIKRFHALDKRKDIVVETFMESQTSSVKHNITVVNLKCKEFHNMDLQGNGEFLDNELLNSKIRNAFAILKPSKVPPLDSQTDPRTTVSRNTMNSPMSRYKRYEKRCSNQNSPIPIEEQEPEKYKRDKGRIAQRPRSQTPRSEIQKYIEAFERNGYFSKTKSGEDAQILSSNLKGQNPGKYKRQPGRFDERPYSETSWEEIEKYGNSFKLKNKNSYFHESRELDQNICPSSREKNLGNSGIQPLEKTHSKRLRNEIGKSPAELDKHSHCELWVQDQNSEQTVEEKKHGKYKRSERRLAERPSSQPSMDGTERYLISFQKWKSSLFLESKSGNSDLGDSDENLTPFTKERKPEKYRRKSQLQERPYSQILSSRIQEYIKAFESRKKCFHRSYSDQSAFGTQDQDQNNSEPEIDSVKYERRQPRFADKSRFQIPRTDLKDSMEPCEHNDQLLSHQIEECTNKSLQEPSNVNMKKIEQKYSRGHQQNNRSKSAPTVCIQTNVPNYFQNSRVDHSGYDFTRDKQNHIKETEETEETHSVERNHCQRLKSPDLTAFLQEKSHLMNGYSERRKRRNKCDISYLQSIFNRRPNKKAAEDIQDYNNIKENIDLESGRYSPFSQKHQKERPPSNCLSKGLHKNTNFDQESTQIGLDTSRETKEISSGDKPESISKENRFHQDNSKANQLLLDSVQTNAPLYYSKLPHEKKSPSTKTKEFKERLKIFESGKSNLTNNSLTDSVSPSKTLKNEIPAAKSKCNSEQNGDKIHFGHQTKGQSINTKEFKETEKILVDRCKSNMSNNSSTDAVSSSQTTENEIPAKSTSNSEQNGHKKHFGHQIKGPSTKTKEFKEPLKILDSCKDNMSHNSSTDYLPPCQTPENESPPKSKYNSEQNGVKKHFGSQTKDPSIKMKEFKEPLKILDSCERNMSNKSSSDSLFPSQTTENKIPAKSKFNSEQSGDEIRFGHRTKGPLTKTKQFKEPIKILDSCKSNMSNNSLTNSLSSSQTPTNEDKIRFGHQTKDPSTKMKDFKEPSKVFDSCKRNMSNNSSTDSVSPYKTPENQIPTKSKYNSEQNGDKIHFEHQTKDPSTKTREFKERLKIFESCKSNMTNNSSTDSVSPSKTLKNKIPAAKSKYNSEKNGDKIHVGHQTKGPPINIKEFKEPSKILDSCKSNMTNNPSTDSLSPSQTTENEIPTKSTCNSEKNGDKIHFGHQTKGPSTKTKEFKEPVKILDSCKSNMSNNSSTDSLSPSQTTENEIPTKSTCNSEQNGHKKHLRHQTKVPSTKMKEFKEPLKILDSCKRNTSNNSSTDSSSPSKTPENEIPAKSKYNSEQNGDKIYLGHLTKDIVPSSDDEIPPLSKRKKSLSTYHHSSENNKNLFELDYHSHPLDEESFQNVPEKKENYSVRKAPENLDSSMDERLIPVRVRNGPNQSSENEMGPAKLDWSISEISIVENEAEELTPVDGQTLLSPLENGIYHFASHDLEVSKKTSTSSLTEINKELKKSFSSSQLSNNSVKINKKLEFPPTKDGIESVKCLFMLRKYFSLWKKEWHRHLAAKILWKRHSLQKGINALRQAVQNSQLVSGVLQERIQKVWLKSCFQKWKQEMSIKLHDQLAAAFKKWKENAKEQKRFRILTLIHHRNVLLLCFQNWRSHHKSKIMLLKALIHDRKSLLYNMWHHWVMFVKQNQQKKYWQVIARKYQRKKLQSRTLKGLVSAYRNSVKAKSHYRLQKLKMVLQFWRRGAAISSHQSEQIVVAVQQCSDQLALRRTLDIWVHQLWLICESRRADRWILSRYMSVWYRKWCCKIVWRRTVVAKIEHQRTHAIIYKWHQNVQLQKKRHKSATTHIQMVLLIQLLTKWRRIAKRQVESRFHLQTQVTNVQHRMKIQVLLKWKNKLLEKQKARQVFYLWSEQCVRKAVSRWKDSHHQATLDKRVLLFEPLRNVLIQKEIFWKWKRAWEKANKEKEDVHRSHVILQQKLLGSIFHKWYSRTQGTLAAKPLIQRRHSQLLLRIFRAWHRFLWEKHQRTKKSFQLQNYHLKQLFCKWRNLFILREKEKNFKIYHCRRLLSKCVLGWQVVIQRKTRAVHFHQRLLLWKFYFWKEKTTHSLRCKAMKEAEQHSCRTVQRHFFSRWRQNAIQQKIHRTESTQHIEKIYKRNVLAQALSSWKHLLKIHILARNHYNHRLVILMKEVLVEWHRFSEYTSCLAIRCLQRRLHIEAWIKCPHISRDHDWHWQKEEVLLEEMDKENGLSAKETHEITGIDKEALATIGHRNQKVMTRVILQLKYWPMSLAFLQWRRYTQLCHQLKTLTQQLHMKHITVILSTTFCLWRQQQQAAKLARRHQEHKLLKRTFREIQKYAVCRRSKKALLTKARNHHCVSVFKTYFPIWQKKVKEKQYWDKAAKLLSHSSPEEQILQPVEFQLTSLLGQRSLQKCFHIWQETYQEASFYRQRYHQILLIRYLHIWRSWAMYRQHLSQKCNIFRKKRIQSLALQVWTCRVHQNKWIKKTQGQKVNNLLLTILREWHQWSSKSSKQKAAEAKVRQNHVNLMLSQVFNSITREFHKINKASQWYQNQLIKKVIVAWSYRSQFQIEERDKIRRFQLQKNKAMIQRTLQIWKHVYLVRCEAKFTRQQRIHQRICCIAVHWKKRAKKTRGKILEAVFTDRSVRFCFSVWRNRFEMMKQLEGQLHLFISWKQQQTQRHLFSQWKSTLLVTRANQSFTNKLLSTVLKGWQKWTRASLLYQKRFQEYQNFLQKRQLESTFRILKIGWKHKQTSTKLFKRNIQSRALKAWYYYVQGQVRLKTLQAYLADQLRARHLLSAYCKWKGMVTARLDERRKERQQAVVAKQHYKTHLSMVFFHAWLQETLVSRCIVRHRMRLAYKYCDRWKYYTDLSYTAALWSEKLSYHRVWSKWRAAFIRETTAANMQAEFCQQNMRQIFRIWYQYCRYKKIYAKESLYPGICLNLANI